MVPWLISLIAIVSTAVCIFLWFRDVRRIMRERKSTVESAARQVAVCQDRQIWLPRRPAAHLRIQQIPSRM